jgi:dolichol-phosphate mannosyltransferase
LSSRAEHRNGAASDPPRPRARPSVCVCVPTYNEAGNVERFVPAVLGQFDRLALTGAVLVIDDNSPDRTGAIADALANADPRVSVLHREAKAGLGRAYQAGFAWALAQGAELIVEMDCDFSHDPADLARLIDGAREADVVLGSRYVPGGAVVDWPLWRRAVSRAGCWYARRVLGLALADLTGGFKCFRRTALERIGFEDVSAAGYGFQIETTYRAARAGLRVVEVPITFRDRTQGSSKMTMGIAREAALLALRLRIRGGIAVAPPPRPVPALQASARSPAERAVAVLSSEGARGRTRWE